MILIPSYFFQLDEGDRRGHDQKLFKKRFRLNVRKYAFSNPLKLHGVPQTNERISATNEPKFTILWGHVEEILLLNKFFSDCQYMP